MSDLSPLRLALAGVSHDHVAILQFMSDRDFAVVAAYDADPKVLEAFSERAGIPLERRFTDLRAMVAAARPNAVAAFGSIYEHLSVVEACAPLGIHVMVEKPLAISTHHAERMDALASAHGIHVLTNYETSWYASVSELFGELESGALGSARKVLIRDGHGGPVETGCQPQFLRWLLDPAMSGGGALTDFGCYGANLMTRMMKGRAPDQVTAILRTFKPDLYPRTEDDALVVLDYPNLQAVIQASWNWPFPRKDIEVHCTRGFVAAPDAHTVVRAVPGSLKSATRSPTLPRQQTEPFSFFAAVIREGRPIEPYETSALANNRTVVQILDAARRSASSGGPITLIDRES